MSSEPLQDAVAERLRRVRLVEECDKLQRPVEQDAAEELFRGEAEWPEY